MNRFFEHENGRTVLARQAPEMLSVDCTEDFILPDYRPEIRKFLRLDAKCVPSGHFIGADRAEFGGTVLYTLYYTDTEGRLTAVPLEGRYEYSLPLAEGAPYTVWSHEAVESVCCRPSGPRKISVRTRIRATPHVYVEREAQSDPALLLPEGAEGTEMLTRKRERAEILAAVSGELTAETTVPVEGVAAEKIRILSSDAEAEIESARAEGESVHCRGVLHIWVLCEREGDSLFSEARRVPFETEIALQGARAGDSVCAHAFCQRVDADLRETAEGAELLLALSYTVAVECHRNLPFYPVADIYSTTLPLHVEKGICKSERFAGGVFCSFTLDGCTPLTEEEAGATVLNAAVSLPSPSLTLLPRRVLLTGDARASLLLAPTDGGAPFISEYTFPFRIEAELPEEVSAEDRCDFTLTPVHAVGRVERGEKGCSVEAVLALSVYHAHEDEVPERISADVGKEYARDGLCRIYYPTSADSLWSVGKRYGLPVSTLCRENELSLPDTSEADDRKTLDGVMWLAVSPS